MIPDNYHLIEVREEWQQRVLRNSSDKRAVEFREKLVALMKEYNFSIAHEDSHGGFIIKKYDTYNVDWLLDAMIEREALNVAHLSQLET